MVSLPTEATMPCFSASRASSRTVQRARPGGGGLHVRATTAASPRASNFFSGFGLGSSVSAASSPRARYRRATRRTSRGYVPVASAVSCIVHFWSSNSRIRIRRQCRAESRPPAFFAASARRSSSASARPRKRSIAFFFGSFTHRYRSLLDLRRKSDRHARAEGLGGVLNY